MKNMEIAKRASGALIALLLLADASCGQVLITDFNNFTSNELYAAWSSPSATIVSGPESYAVTATGYGSNYVYLGSGIFGEGNTHLELDVTLSGPPAADGQLGPIISLIDGDGSYYNYAWYGQTLGDHLLTMRIDAPTWISAPGAIEGLDLFSLTHMHMQLDPAQFGASGAYTIEWKNLNLITLAAVPGDFDGDYTVDGADFLLWQRNPAVGDLADWRANFGAAGAGLPTVAAVPEPAAWSLVVIFGIGLASRRRYRHSYRLRPTT